MKRFPPKQKLNFSKQVTKKDYAKHLTEDERLDLATAMVRMREARTKT